MAERLLNSVKKDWPCIDYVVGTFAKHHFGEIIDAIEENRPAFQPDDTEEYKFAKTSYEQGNYEAFVPIMHGCNNFCTYCIVPYLRGREISRNADEILQELDVLNSYGVKDVTLLGQNVNSYRGKDSSGNELNFAMLLQKIADHLKETNSKIGWIRFMSSHPKDFTDDVISVIAKEEVLCKHIHLPVQNGSTIWSGVRKSGSPTVKLTTSSIPMARLNISRIGDGVTLRETADSSFMYLIPPFFDYGRTTGANLCSCSASMV